MRVHHFKIDAVYNATGNNFITPFHIFIVVLFIFQ